ncbi:PREDICTED: uncharacterized protein LOC106819444, partial [Priapulus caudatus]|uniref:Uncharacterized protein LOC106819444 n=1 Tax=Priapulus caudatus TaxID=37621 RepID=A0ABM1F542_PRICU
MAKIETQRLTWFRLNQKTVKAEKYRCVMDAVENGEEMLPGKRTILPPTMYASPRWYARQFQDAMSIVREYGKPTYFITFTCNPNWPEITQSLLPGQTSYQRPDIVARVFHMKWEALLNVVLKQDALGHCDAYCAVKETQKRHLPHGHALFTMVPADQPRTPADIDRVVCAEIPDRSNSELYRIVTQHMIHGPCGALNSKSPCMDEVKGECTKGFPKELRNHTVFADNSFPLHRRRKEPDSPGIPFTKTLSGGVEVSVGNEWVVPYCPVLSLKFDCHINVEPVGGVDVVKYLYKYIHKGPDRCMVRVGGPVEDITHDEIKRYEVGRYISASEACWRIFDFPVQKKYPAVEQLSIHLEDEQQIVFSEEGEVQHLLDSGPPTTTLTAFFQAMQQHPDKNDVLYPDVYKYFTWEQKTRTFKWRKRGRSHN